MEKTSRVRWWSNPAALFRYVLMLDDTPHSIAMGVAVGMFIGMTPTVGFQMILVVALGFATRRLFQFNRVAALITVYISNPVTVVPIYWFCYKVGTLIFDGDLTREDFAGILQYEGFAEWWETVLELFLRVGAALVVGSLIVATICAAVAYPIMRWLLWLARPGTPAGLGKDAVAG